MKRAALIMGLGLPLMLLGCGEDSVPSSGTGGTGGTGTGGMAGTAGTGGMAGEGGMAGTGGLAGEGGMAGTGGMAGEGGMAGTGGAGGEGGMAGTGGAGGEGGIAGTGGAGGEGGTGGTGGAGGEGGTGGNGTSIITAGSGQTEWIAQSTPIGSNGGPTATGAGCSVFVTALNTTIYLQVTLTLDVTSDGANNISTDWRIDAQHFLLPTLSNAAELGDLSINAAVSNASIGGASPGLIASGLTAAATGQLIGAFIAADVLSIATPGEITEGSGAAVPIGGVGSTVNVNWNGAFTLDLTLAGNPLVTVDQEVCTFDIQGTGVDFAVN